MTDRRPLEPDSGEMQALNEAVADRLVDWIGSLPDRPASDTSNAPDVADRVSGLPPEVGRPLNDLLDEVFATAEIGAEAAGPGYMAYIPGGGLYASAVADWVASALNRYTGVAGLAPAAAALEQSVLAWMCELFDFPDDAQGLLLSGGSLANLTALSVARQYARPDRVDDAVVYCGEHVHASVVKAARTIGIAPANVRTIGSDEDFRMRPDELAEAVRTDRDGGPVPACVVAAAGTTNAGVIDPLDDIADVADHHGVWLHVDAAYGGFFQLTDRGRARLDGIGRAESISLDPHKSLFVPYGTGALLVRHRRHLVGAFSQRADYLQDLAVTGQPDFNELSPELSRPWRGLSVWLPLHLHGVAAFREQLDEKLNLARHAYERLSADPNIDVIGEPDLTVVAFRLADGDDGEQTALLEAVNDHQRVLLSSTRLEGRTTLRIAILAHRTHRGRVDQAIELIRMEAARLTRQR